LRSGKARWNAEKLIYGTETWKYYDRLKFLGLTRLDKRRIRSDLVETFKLLNGFCNVCSLM